MGWSRRLSTPFRPKFILAVVLAVAALALAWQGINLAVGYLFPREITAVFGHIEVGRWVEAAVVRRETLITAPVEGIFKAGQEEFERTAYDGHIGSVDCVDGGLREVRAPGAGLVVYAWDDEEKLGLEETLKDPVDVFTRVRAAAPHRTSGARVREGDPVASLIDDTEQYLVVELDENPGGLSEGGKLWARVDADLVPLTLLEKVDQSHGTWLVLRTDRFPRVWLQDRSQRIYLVLGQYTGTVIPLRCVHVSEGRTGVTAMVDGRAKFIEIRIVGQDRRQAVVDGISEGTMLVP